MTTRLKKTETKLISHTSHKIKKKNNIELHCKPGEGGGGALPYLASQDLKKDPFKDPFKDLNRSLI